jgi:hypothetical protein
MYTLVRSVQTRDGLLVEAPAIAASLAIAETFYKFHSFTLECVCFLATWLALSSVLSLVMGRAASPGTPE